MRDWAMGIKSNATFLILFFLISAGITNGQNSVQSNDSTYEKNYKEAVIDAMIADDSEICSTLVVIKPDNHYLNWANGYVLVVTLTKDCSSYYAGDTISTSSGDIWVTAVPELKDWYKIHPVSSDKITLRTEELLGIPFNLADSCLVEIWAKPDDLFRPAYDNAIDKNFSENNFPVNVNSEYVTWFNNNIISSYYPPNGKSKYPWTRLGYTYDWGNPAHKIGLSEFVIKKNSRVIIKSTQPIKDYIH
jgi:hypothetical protein